MRINKSIISSIIIVLHLLTLVWYYKHPSEWCLQNKTISYPIFYSSFIWIAINMFLSSISKNAWLFKQFLRIHSLFILGLGSTYILSYSGLIEINQVSKLYYTLLFLVIVFLSIICSAINNKFFKEED